jgi:hypothetical protein
VARKFGLKPFIFKSEEGGNPLFPAPQDQSQQPIENVAATSDQAPREPKGFREPLGTGIFLL